MSLVRRPSLRLRILAPAALVAIPALALLVSMSFERRRQSEVEAMERAQQLAQLATVDQERLIEGTRQLLIAMSQSLDVREGNVDGCNAYLKQLIKQYEESYNNLGVADRSGQVLCQGFGVPINVSDREYFIRAMATRGFSTGQYTLGRQSGRPSLAFAYPVIDAGVIKGVVYAAVDLTKLNKALTDGDWPKEASLTVTDRHNVVVASFPDWQGVIGKPLNDVDARLRANAANHDEHDLVAYGRVAKPADTGLAVRVTLSRRRAMAAANRATYESLAVLGLVSFFVIVSVRAASDRLLLRPIKELTRASRMIAAGDFGARAASSTTIPELSELGKDFDDMAGALEERESARLRSELERKVLEQQYHQAQKMDAVGRLAGGIAHDFNNVLTAILGYCELLMEDPDISPAHREDVSEIDKAGRTAAGLTRQLLAFSRRDIVEPVAIDFNDIIAGMDRMVHRLLGDHIKVESRLGLDLWAVKADRGQVEQVMLNLLVNARDAMPQGGKVIVETANVARAEGIASPFLAAPAGRYVMLSVTDAGTGIDPDVLTHLFEPFFTTKGTGKGTGLGLATVYGIVKQANGAIEVKSRLGQGSVFRVYLPQTLEVPAGVQTRKPVERVAVSEATILVVEDDAGIRDLTEKVLARYGYSILSASGGEEARTVCEGHQGSIDLLLSDVVMPGMSGPKVAEALTRLRPSMKVIYMSGYTDDAVLKHGVMAHDVPFLQKPFTPERLANKILEVLSH